MTPENEAKYGDSFCRLMIENMYQEMLPLAWSHQAGKAMLCIHKLEVSGNAVAATILPTADSVEFSARFNKMREGYGDVMESENHRSQLVSRLGITHLQPGHARRRSSPIPVGELIARTAVRATVWETVRSIFRMFR